MSDPGAVSFTAPDDYIMQMAQAQRQQQLAQALEQQGSEPIQVQSAGGFAGPISPLSVLAKALDSYAGGQLANSAMQSQVAAQRGQQTQTQNWLSNATAPQFNPVTITPPVAPTPGNGLPVAPSATPITDPARQAAYNQPATSPPSYSDIFASAMKGMALNNPIINKMAPELAAGMKPTYMEQAPGQQLLQNQNGNVTPIGSPAPLLPTDQQRNWLTAGAPGSPGYEAAKARDLFGVQTPTEVQQKEDENKANNLNRVIIQQNAGLPPPGTQVAGVTGDPVPHPEKPGYATMPVPNTGGFDSSRA